MQDRRARDILAESEAAYKGAVTDPATHGPAAERLVLEASRQRDAEALIVALRALAWARHVRLDNVSARKDLNRAVRLAERRGMQSRLGDVLLSRAAVSHELGDLPAARRDLARAGPLVAPDRRAEVLLQEAAIHQSVGDLGAAARLYRSALDQPWCPPEIRAKVANNLALAEVQLGRYGAAIEHIEVAAQAAHDAGPVLVAIVAQSRAWVTMQAGRLAESLDHFAAAEQLYVRADLPLDEHYIEYADALVDLRLVPEALRVARRAVSELAAHGADLMAAEGQVRLARLLLLTGDAAAARDTASRAAATFRRQRRTAWVARAVVVAHQAQAALEPLDAARLRSLRGCARTLEQLGLTSEAIPAYLAVGVESARRGRVADASEVLGRADRLARGAPVLVRLKGRIAAARLAQLHGDAAAVLRQSRAGLRDLAAHRAALPSMELRALASDHGADLGALGLAALLPRAGPSRVLDWLERTRAAALVTVDLTDGVDLQADAAALRSLHHEQGARDVRRLEGGDDHDARLAAVEARVRRAAWQRGPGPPADVVPVAELRELLGDTVLVEYGCAGDRLVAVVLRRRGARLVPLGELATVRRSTDALLFALRRLTRAATPASVAAARSSAEHELDVLRRELVLPLGVSPTSPLVVVPVGDLQRIPWSPLHDGVVTVAPSASVWARTRRAAGRPVRDVALVAGPRLPGAVAEVAALAEVHNRATALVPPDSTVEAVVAALAAADLAHLACHGRMRADNPMFSTLELSDGPLTVHELTARRATPYRIVLAACDSGVQTTYAGEETLGFVSALLARGTAALVASTVLVPDLDAVPLMLLLHRALAQGSTVAESLHRARGAVDLSAPGDFVSWCAFNAYGAA